MGCGPVEFPFSVLGYLLLLFSFRSYLSSHVYKISWVFSDFLETKINTFPIPVAPTIFSTPLHYDSWASELYCRHFTTWIGDVSARTWHCHLFTAFCICFCVFVIISMYCKYTFLWWVARLILTFVYKNKCLDCSRSHVHLGNQQL